MKENNNKEIIEIWKPIEGYEGQYEVSNIGRVKSLSRIAYRDFRYKKHSALYIKERIKKPYVLKNGYITIALIKNNKTNITYLHRIIAEAFIKKPIGCNIVNHKNGVKTDNRIENLEWCTSGYNNLHAIRNRLRKPANACLDEKNAIRIIEMRKQKLTHIEIARILKISKCTVRGFLSGNSYKWLRINISDNE